jgi:hypothetical protein
VPELVDHAADQQRQSVVASFVLDLSKLSAKCNKTRP